MDKDKVSKWYDKLNELNCLPKFFYEYIANNNLEGDILDIGCGRGEIVKRLINDRNNLFAFDISRKTIDNLKKSKIRAKFWIDNAESFITNKKFDFILLIEVIEHLENPKKCLKLIKKHLKKDGKIILSFPNRFAYFPFYKIAEKIKPSKFSKRFLFWEHPLKSIQPIDKSYSFNEIKKMLSKSEFKIIKIKGIDYFPYIFSNDTKIRKYFNNFMEIFNIWPIAYRIVIIAE